jgi:peptidyl-prolyl cis-trans isomerase D
MLRGIRTASRNWLGKAVMGTVMGLLIISFAIWGIGDIFRGFGQSSVAKVGGREITINEFRQIYNDRLQQIGRQIGRPVTPQQARALGFDRQVLGQVIAEIALDERARQLGLNLSDEEIAKRIREDPTFRGFTGQFDRARFEQMIRQAGYTEPRFVAEQRRVSLRRQLAEGLGGELRVPDTMAQVFNRFEEEQRTVEYVVLDRAKAGDVPQPTPEELAQYFEGRKHLFRSPEYRKAVLIVLSPADALVWIGVSDDDAKRTYEQRRQRYVTPERRQVQQIVFPSAADARAAADRLAGGVTFEALAAERELKDSDIDLGLVAKTGIVDRAVADAAFALKEGETSQPVEGRFGTAIVRVTKIEPERVRSYEEVAPELKKELATERAKTEIQDRHDKIEDERGGGAQLTEIAQKLGLTAHTIEAVDRSGRAPDGAPVALPGGRRHSGEHLRLRRRRRQRLGPAAGRRLRLVRGVGRDTLARAQPRRGQGSGGSALARRQGRRTPARQGDRARGQAEGRHGAGRDRHGRRPEGRDGERPQAQQAGRRPVGDRARGRVPHRQGRRRYRRRASARGAHRVPRDRGDHSIARGLLRRGHAHRRAAQAFALRRPHRPIPRAAAERSRR